MTKARSAERSFKQIEIKIGRSLLVERLAESGQRFATVEQWRNFIANMAGAPREEREACISGLSGFMAAGESGRGKLSIDEVTSSCYEGLSRFTPIVGSFTTKSYRPSVEVRGVAGQLPDRVEPRALPFVAAASACYKHPALGYWIVKSGYADLATVPPNWIVLDERGRLVNDPASGRSWFRSDIKALDVMHLAINARFADYEAERAFLQYGKHLLPGGANAREWLIQVPHWPSDYCDPHFEVCNLVAHLRTTERRSVSGEPVFFVEEIQSDWHAQFRKISARSIVAPPEDPPPFRNSWHELCVKVAVAIASRQGFSLVGFSNARTQFDRWDER